MMNIINISNTSREVSLSIYIYQYFISILVLSSIIYSSRSHHVHATNNLTLKLDKANIKRCFYFLCN